MSAGGLCAGALLIAGLALPWAGWEGLRTVGFGLGLIGAASLAAGRRWRWVWLAALALGLASVVLLIWRIGTVPSSPLVREWRSAGALVLGLAGATVLTLTSAASLLSARQPRVSETGVLSSDQRAALAAVWRAAWTSRLLVWVTGVVGVLDIGFAVRVHPGLARPFASFGNLLTAPASAWDAGAYLMIAQGGYGSYHPLRAFFPLYPVLIRAGAWSLQAAVIVGILLSLAAFGAALYLLHRLMALERGGQEADLLVLLVAFFPMALFFSAIYTESLFLALSVGSFYAARRGWWARAGLAGALASATRVTGALLLLPLIVLYRYGPREDRREAPPHRLEWDAAWIALVPVGLLAYLAYMGAHGDVLGPLHAQHTYWYRSFVPGLGAVHGVTDAVRSVRQIIEGPSSHVLARVGFGPLTSPMRLATADLIDFGFLLFACVAAVGALRRLPRAYGLYAAAVILLTVSSFPPHEPLESFPRFALTIFPCLMWLAIWAQRRERQAVALALSAGLLGFFAAQFATWHWVA